MAGRLGVSRAAVGKHVAQLRREGSLVESSTKKGFRLRVAAEAIDPKAVFRRLTTESLGRGRWVCLAETASTNTEAAALALAGCEAGTVVTAESQSRGKGRRGRGWFSTPRALQFSLVLRPGAGGGTSRALTGAAQRALVCALRASAPVVPAIKAPNDILLGGRKVAGILVEMGLRGGEADWLVLGVGCNVNAALGEFPSEIAGVTTSVFVEAGVAVSRNVLLAEFLNALEPLL